MRKLNHARLCAPSESHEHRLNVRFFFLCRVRFPQWQDMFLPEKQVNTIRQGRLFGSISLSVAENAWSSFSFVIQRCRLLGSAEKIGADGLLSTCVVRRPFHLVQTVRRSDGILECSAVRMEISLFRSTASSYLFRSSFHITAFPIAYQEF